MKPSVISLNSLCLFIVLMNSLQTDYCFFEDFFYFNLTNNFLIYLTLSVFFRNVPNLDVTVLVFKSIYTWYRREKRLLLALLHKREKEKKEIHWISYTERENKRERTRERERERERVREWKKLRLWKDLQKTCTEVYDYICIV